MKPKPETTIKCNCGKIGLQLVGKPIMTVVCYCDDCQRASAELQALRPGQPLMDQAGGTPYVLFRRDRVRIISGEGLLRDHRIENEPMTKRVIAGCCHTPLFLDFEKGHWLSLFRDRFPPPVPPIQMRNNAKYAPDRAMIPRDAPQSLGFPLGFIARLISSKIAMDLARPFRKRS